MPACRAQWGMLRLELLTVGAIVDPFAGCGDPLAGGDDGGVADHGHQIALTARVSPEHAEAVLGVVEGDPLTPVRWRSMTSAPCSHTVLELALQQYERIGRSAYVEERYICTQVLFAQLFPGASKSLTSMCSNAPCRSSRSLLSSTNRSSG